MKNHFQRLAQRMAVWMQGRYGNDDLGNALVALGIITMLASILPHCGWLSYVALAAMALAIWRTCSKNIGKRQQENQSYLRLSAKPRRSYPHARRGQSPHPAQAIRQARRGHPAKPWRRSYPPSPGASQSPHPAQVDRQAPPQSPAKPGAVIRSGQIQPSSRARRRAASSS